VAASFTRMPTVLLRLAAILLTGGPRILAFANSVARFLAGV